MAQTKQYCVLLSRADRDALAQLADREHVSAADAVRRAIHFTLAANSARYRYGSPPTRPWEDTGEDGGEDCHVR